MPLVAPGHDIIAENLGSLHSALREWSVAAQTGNPELEERWPDNEILSRWYANREFNKAASHRTELPKQHN